MFRKFKKISLLFFLLFLWGQQAEAAFELQPAGVWQRALGNAGLASGPLDFMAYNNPARLGSGAKPLLSLLYRNYYGLADLNRLALSLSVPLRDMGLGLDIMRLGNKSYSATTVSAGVAIRLESGFMLGLSVNTYILEIRNYGYDAAFGLQLAMQYRIGDHLNMAVVTGNLNEPVLGAGHEAIPVFGRVGLAWQATDRVSLYTDALYERQWDTFFGLSFRINDHFRLMTGTQYLTNGLSAGFLLNMDKIRLGYALELHPELSYSHTMDIQYAF